MRKTSVSGVLDRLRMLIFECLGCRYFYIASSAIIIKWCWFWIELDFRQTRSTRQSSRSAKRPTEIDRATTHQRRSGDVPVLRQQQLGSSAGDRRAGYGRCRAWIDLLVRRANIAAGPYGFVEMRCFWEPSAAVYLGSGWISYSRSFQILSRYDPLSSLLFQLCLQQNNVYFQVNTSPYKTT